MLLGQAGARLEPCRGVQVLGITCPLPAAEQVCRRAPAEATGPYTQGHAFRGSLVTDKDGKKEALMKRSG